MQSTLLVAMMSSSSLAISMPVNADSLDDLKQEILQMRQEYEHRITDLEARLTLAENKTQQVETQIDVVKALPTPSTITPDNNGFNPAISMVLNGQFNHYEHNPDDYIVSGFSIPGEGGLAPQGFSIGESELTFSANVDQLFFGQLTFALHDDGGETELEIEEAYIETLSLNHGLTIRAGRFFSPISYLNEKHIHAWNFADAPLIYRSLFGNQLITDGVKGSYILPTEQYIELGTTVGAGNHYPTSGDHDGIGDWLLYAKTGGDIGINNSWQLGVSYWQARPDDRPYRSGLDHGHSSDESVVFNGNTDITNLSFIYKWAPQGNFKQQNLTLLSEYFYQHDNGQLSIEDELTRYDGKQYGGFVEGIYQFLPRWRTGLRYDYLGSGLDASDTELLDDAGLDFTGFHPQRYSLMLEWFPSEFSRLRAQVNHDLASENSDNQILLQYTITLGAHGAHNF